MTQHYCCVVLPPVDPVTGNLPPGVHESSWAELEAAFGSTRWCQHLLLDFRDRRAEQKATFGGEMFVASWGADPEGTRFLDFFQIDKNTGDAKGIVAIDLGALR